MICTMIVKYKSLLKNNCIWSHILQCINFDTNSHSTIITKQQIEDAKISWNGTISQLEPLFWCSQKPSIFKQLGLDINYTKNGQYIITKINEHTNKECNINKEYTTNKEYNTNMDVKKSKGHQCSVNGSKYELQIHSVVKKCTINGKLFNTQHENELAGSSSKNDINCNYNNIEDIGIEIKKYNTPDWMQCSIKYDIDSNRWVPSSRGKNSKECQDIFTNLINSLNLYDGDIPPFMTKSITHEDWIKIKKETNKWEDKYIDISPDTIRRLYSSKGCAYIQISDNYGLYHLGSDTCNFNVPLFEIEQQLRIRTKIHTRKNKKGFCNLSITVACQPKNIKNLIRSNYSLDNKDKIPNNLTYDGNN